MIIDCVSDLHGHFPKLEGGDLLIVAGDLTGRDTFNENLDFEKWVEEQKYKKVIVIGGNHDNVLEQDGHLGIGDYNGKRSEYLCDSGIDFQGFKIWGSPWTLKFQGQNPRAMAFCLGTEKQLAEKWSLIPDSTDILVTHSPPNGILDEVNNRWKCGVRSGSLSLKERVVELDLKLHVFGHIHGSYGKTTPSLETQTIFVNASHVDEEYRPINKPIRIILEDLSRKKQ